MLGGQDSYSPHPFQAVSIEVTLAQTGPELVITPCEQRALTGLVVDHMHLIGPPVLIQVLPVAFEGQCLEQRILAVVKLNLKRAVVFLVDPQNRPR